LNHKYLYTDFKCLCCFVVFAFTRLGSVRLFHAFIFLNSFVLWFAAKCASFASSDFATSNFFAFVGFHYWFSFTERNWHYIL